MWSLVGCLLVGLPDVPGSFFGNLSDYVRLANFEERMQHKKSEYPTGVWEKVQEIYD